ncbi:MAG: CGNR zinc finger domain-containing protein [Microbacterium sp.]|uniref:CGNR zinc finger domain-containing protein n=1 Tax=Microbacterium sp. TaxID=51671 RepID=UPI0039E40F29
MVFIHDTRMALAAAAELVNTRPATSLDGGDRLASNDDLTAFLRRFPFTGTVRHDAAELESVRALRGRLRELWGTDREGAVPLVNAMLWDGRALPQLVIHDEYDWHVHATRGDEPLATRIMVEAAMAFVDVIRADAYERVRVCAAADCDGVYIDFSRNGSKRYCDTGNCGNRMNVNAYRRRKAADSS